MPVATSPRRRRPAVHLTPPQGWLNDAYGIVRAGGRYHLFHQHVPGSTSWAPDVHWAHAASLDLIGWQYHPAVLSPDERDDGCWSGSATVDGDRVTLFYTAVREPVLSLGAVRRAIAPTSPGEAIKDPGPPIIQPPEDLDLTEFRDPFVWRDEDGWKAVVGCAVRGRGGAIVQYSSSLPVDDGSSGSSRVVLDQQSWRYDGVVLAADPDDEVWTGSMWECPQLFPLAEAWVLLVSVWHDHRLHHVMAAIGDYDGRRFVPRRWQRLDHGPVAYATTAFLDRDGRRCMLSWLRQEPDPDTAWTGALGLPFVLSLDGDRLGADLHPDLLAYRTAEVRLGAQPALLDLDGEAMELDVACDAGLGQGVGPVVATTAESTGAARVRVTVREPGQRDGHLLEISLEISGAPGGQDLVVAAAGQHEPIRVPLPDAAGVDERLRVVLDADIVEITHPRCGPISLRLPDAPPAVQVSVDGPAAPRARSSAAYRLRSPWGALHAPR